MDKPIEERIKTSSKLLHKYPDRVPVIINKLSKYNAKENLTKTKFVVPSCLTVGQFLYIVRKYMENLREEKALFFMIYNTNIIPPTGDTFEELYKKHKNDDGFLYCVVYTENVFG